MEQEETAMEITAKELMEMNPEELLIIDIRNEYDRNYGLIPGSVWADAQELVLNPPEERSKIPSSTHLTNSAVDRRACLDSAKIRFSHSSIFRR